MRWQLSRIYPAINSPEFEADLDLARKLTAELEETVFASVPDNIKTFENAAVVIEKLRTYLALTLMIENANTEAKSYLNIAERLAARLDNQKANLAWQYKKNPSLFQDEALRKSYKGFLNQLKDLSVIDAGVVKAVQMMSLTGGRAWRSFHNENLDAAQKETGISVGQLTNVIRTGSDDEAAEAFAQIGRIAEKAAPVSLEALNNIKGEFLTVTHLYDKSSPQAYALEKNRITPRLFNTYIQCAGRIGARAIDAYKEITGKKSFTLFEIDRSGAASVPLNYDACLNYVKSCYEDKSPKMTLLIAKAASNNLIDNEPRLGKRAGACMCELYAAKESYILSNDTGSLRALKSLAHEFGHVYHYDCMFKHSVLETTAPVVITECISKLSEMIVLDYLYRQNSIPQNYLREMWVKDLITTMCYTLSRFYFEDMFFELRSQKPLTLEQTRSLMKQSLAKAFHGVLSASGATEYDWVLKPHYYYIDRAYYNFPYIIGMISAMLIFAKIKKNLISFPELELILAETGRMENYEDFLAALKITPDDIAEFDIADLAVESLCLK